MEKVVNRDEDTSKPQMFFTLTFLQTLLNFPHTHTYYQSDMDLPCSRGPKCSAAGDGGGEGGKLVESSTVDTENESREWGMDIIKWKKIIIIKVHTAKLSIRMRNLTYRTSYSLCLISSFQYFCIQSMICFYRLNPAQRELYLSPENFQQLLSKNSSQTHDDRSYF